MNARKITDLLILLLFISSCNNKVETTKSNHEEILEIINPSEASKGAPLMNMDEYVKWVQHSENGFRKDKKIEELTFSALYKPYEYIVSMEEKKDELADSIVKKQTEELSDMQYFDFKISLNDGMGELLKYNLQSKEEYSKRVNYFAFDMQKDIMLVEGNDTLPCLLYHFERTYDVAPSAIFLLGFSITKYKNAEEKTLIVYDRTFNKGLLKFTFNINELRNLPKLKTV